MKKIYYNGEIYTGTNETVNYVVTEKNMIVEVDLERSENVRRWWPFLRDRRIDEYGNLTKRFID